jgi:predicted anti-sigma-YlaC factor YlaD
VNNGIHVTSTASVHHREKLRSAMSMVELLMNSWTRAITAGVMLLAAAMVPRAASDPWLPAG